MPLNTDSDAEDSAFSTSPSSPRRNPLVLLACGFGLGYARYAPGTIGAVWGLPLAFAIGRLPWFWQLPLIAVVCTLGVPLCGYAARRLNTKDPGAVVFDEISSLPITYFLVPLSGKPYHVLLTLLAGFALHRVFDIFKPPPARQLERLPGGLGIMADDWAAGVYSCLSLHGLLWLVSKMGQ